MGKAKIDRSEMFKLLDANPGKWTNSALAERYDVSTTAVWKARNKGRQGSRRAERKTKPKVKAIKHLSPDEVLYVEQKRKYPDATHKQIGDLAFPELEYAMQKAQRLSKIPMVQEALRDKLHAVGLTQDFKATKLKDHCDSDDDATSLKALDMSFKVTGDYAPKEAHNLHIHADISPVNLDRFKTRTE